MTFWWKIKQKLGVIEAKIYKINNSQIIIKLLSKCGSEMLRYCLLKAIILTKDKIIQQIQQKIPQFKEKCIKKVEYLNSRLIRMFPAIPSRPFHVLWIYDLLLSIELLFKIFAGKQRSILVFQFFIKYLVEVTEAKVKIFNHHSQICIFLLNKPNSTIFIIIVIKRGEQAMEQQFVEQFCEETLQSTKDLKKKITKLQEYEESYKQYRNQINYAFTYPNQYTKSQIEYLINYSELQLNKFIKVIKTLSEVDQRSYVQYVNHYQQYLKEHRELIALFQKQQKFIEKVKQSKQINQRIFAQYLESLSMKHFFRGMMLLMGSFIIHLIIGLQIGGICFYKITNQPYLVVTEDSFAAPLSLFSMGLGMRVGLRVNQTLGTLSTIILSLFSAAGAVYVSSLMSTFVQYVMFSFAIFPFIICFSFQLIISECINYYPKYRLFINGFILTSNALGHVLFGLISIQCFNPEDLQAKNGFFGNELDFIARQVPRCTKDTFFLILYLGTIAVALIYPAVKFNENMKNQSRKQSNRLDFQHNCASQKQALKLHIFWVMVAMILCTTSANYFLITNFKNLASKYHKNTINLAGVLLGFNLANALSRAFWEVLFTKIGFKWCMVILTTLNAINLGTISLILNQFNIYRLYYIIGGATLGGCMVCFLNFTNLVFGQYVGQQLPGYIRTSYSLANLLQYAVFNSYDLANFGFVPSCIFLSMLSVISLLIVVSIKMQGSWQNKLHLLEAKCCFN